MFSVHYCFFFNEKVPIIFFCHCKSETHAKTNNAVKRPLFVSTQNYYFYSIELNQRLTKLARAKTFYRG